tara:strand:- start:200 stop:406 length:207 start_codon:yes stop_codon:yes gene_type:complete
MIKLSEDEVACIYHSLLISINTTEKAIAKVENSSEQRVGDLKIFKRGLSEKQKLKEKIEIYLKRNSYS